MISFYVIQYIFHQNVDAVSHKRSREEENEGDGTCQSRKLLYGGEV